MHEIIISNYYNKIHYILTTSSKGSSQTTCSKVVRQTIIRMILTEFSMDEQEFSNWLLRNGSRAIDPTIEQSMTERLVVYKLISVDHRSAICFVIVDTIR